MVDLSRDHAVSRHGLLYPLMVIAALGVIVFSILGIAAISGWIPSPMMGNGPVSAAPSALIAQTKGTAPAADPAASPTFQCAECSVVESVREIEERVAPEPASQKGGSAPVAPAKIVSF